MAVQSTSHVPDRRLSVAGAIIGVALGGFFDGILLHQVLQWHHLLSLVPGESLRNLEAQILADGMFHVLMYAVAAVGLWLLWRARAGFSGTGADRLLLGSTVLGFSTWQFVDVVLFHWILGIHRIRVDVANPLVWDIGWLLVFGVPTLILGVWLRRSASNGGGGVRRATAAAAAVAIAAFVAGPVAALPPPGNTTALVVFSAGTSAADAFAAAAAADARVVWADPSGAFLAVDFGTGGDPSAFYRGGALLVSRSAALAGCLIWSRA